jgi:hypothetical protein
MIEVFKTNVEHRDHANVIIDQIRESFDNYTANFDLEDCDNILRVECNTGQIQSAPLIKLLAEFGFQAEVLEDDLPSMNKESICWFIR